jgi:hypothetical protein
MKKIFLLLVLMGALCNLSMANTGLNAIAEQKTTAATTEKPKVKYDKHKHKHKHKRFKHTRHKK